MISKTPKRSFFTVLKSSSDGRLGKITTDHGVIHTPAFVPVGTQATVKSVSPEELKSLGVQLYFVNTYHMMIRPGVKVIKKIGGIHSFMNWDKPLITDSGGFQVFSLGRLSTVRGGDKKAPALLEINDKGVTFRSHWDGKKHELTPSKSIAIQHELGADLIIAFDDCATYPITKEKALQSLKRTHTWAIKSLKEHKKRKKRDKKRIYIYGAIQGSVFKDLRIKAARFTTSLDFDGYAIGGVSVGESKHEMEKVLKWVVPILPKDKPRHLLGVGELDDVFTLVSYGIDTFDCVLPTRLARMGYLLTVNKNVKKGAKPWLSDITMSSFETVKAPFDSECVCYTCTHFSSAYIHHLFKVKELLGYRLATIHNIYFMENLMRKVRKAIEENTMSKLKKEYLF